MKKFVVFLNIIHINFIVLGLYRGIFRPFWVTRHAVENKNDYGVWLCGAKPMASASITTHPRNSESLGFLQTREEHRTAGIQLSSEVSRYSLHRRNLTLIQ